MENNEEKKDNKIKERSAKKTECNGIVNCLPLDAKNGIKLTPPQGFEVDKVEVIDGVLNVTFKPQERKLPKSWEEFCEMYPNYVGEFFIGSNSSFIEFGSRFKDRNPEKDRNILPDYATAEAVLALCQLIQLRNCYNGDWVPDCKKVPKPYTIDFSDGEIRITRYDHLQTTPLYFKTEELAKEFLRNFRPLIEKLKPLYGIKEGGEE